MEAEGILDGYLVNQASFQIALRTHGDQWCSGVIIDKQFVLTVAQCVITGYNEFTWERIKVYAGISNLHRRTNQKVVMDIIEAYVPDTYDGRKKYPVGDIAVLKVNKSHWL